MLKEKSIDLKDVFDAGTYDINSLASTKETTSDSPPVNYGIVDENIKNTGNVFILHEKESEVKGETNDIVDASLICDEDEPKLKICSANSTPVKCGKKSNESENSDKNKEKLKSPIKMSSIDFNHEVEENEKKKKKG